MDSLRELTWRIEFLPYINVPTPVDFIVKRDSQIFLSTLHPEGGYLICLRKKLHSSENWVMEEVDPEPLNTLFISMGLLKGVPVITYMDFLELDLKMAYRKEDGTWQVVTLEAPYDVGGFPRVNIIPDDELAIAFYDYSNSTVKLGTVKLSESSSELRWNSVTVAQLPNAKFIDLAYNAFKDIFYIAVRLEDSVGLCVGNPFKAQPELRTLKFPNMPLYLNLKLTDEGRVVLGTIVGSNLYVLLLDEQGNPLCQPKRITTEGKLTRFGREFGMELYRDELLLSTYDLDRSELVFLRIPIKLLEDRTEREVVLDKGRYQTIDAIGDVGRYSKLKVTNLELDAQEDEKLTLDLALLTYWDEDNQRLKLAQSRLQVSAQASITQTPAQNIEDLKSSENLLGGD